MQTKDRNYKVLVFLRIQKTCPDHNGHHSLHKLKISVSVVKEASIDQHAQLLLQAMLCTELSEGRKSFHNFIVVRISLTADMCHMQQVEAHSGGFASNYR